MSLIEKLDGVLAAVSPLSSKSTPTDVMRASAKALDLLRDHVAAIRQDMIDARRYRELRDAFLWALTSGSDGTRLSVYMPGVFLDAIGPDDDEFDAALDAAIDARLASDSEGGSDAL